MRATVYTLEHGRDTLVGALTYDQGALIIPVGADPLLTWIATRPTIDPATGQRIEPHGEAWFRALPHTYRSAYLRVALDNS